MCVFLRFRMSRGILKPSWRLLGASWRASKSLGGSWKRLVRLFALFGSLLEPLGSLLEPLASLLERLRAFLEPAWGPLGALLEASWRILKPLGASWSFLEPS